MRAGREPGRVSVLLVNPTAADLIDVVVQTGGHYSDDSVGVVESTAKDKTFGRVAAGAWTEIEHPEQDELDEFVVWWKIAHGHEVRTSTMFALFKGRDAIGCAAVPVLGGPGALIPRSA
jgi:hypothetical protein